LQGFDSVRQVLAFSEDIARVRLLCGGDEDVLLAQGHGWDAERAASVVTTVARWRDLQEAEQHLSTLLADGKRPRCVLNRDQIVYAVQRAVTTRTSFHDSWHGSLANAVPPADYNGHDLQVGMRSSYGPRPNSQR